MKKASGVGISPVLLQAMLALPVALGSASSNHVAMVTAATPLGKVLELLEGMLQKTREAKHAEEVQWTAYRQFCTDEESVKQADVKVKDVQLEVLKATVQKQDLEVVRLATAIEGHKADVTGYKNDLNTSTMQRTSQHVDYSALHLDYTESIKALTEAIQVLKEQSHDRPQEAASLLQQVALNGLTPASARQTIKAFLQNSQDPDLNFVAPPEANAYEFQSHGIVQMLKDLLEKFRTKLTELEKQELTERHAQEMFAHDLSTSIAAAESEASKALLNKGRAEQASLTAKTEQSELSALRAADAQYLEDLRATCQQKASAFESRAQLRAEEIEAIEKAVAILSSAEVLKVAEKHLPAMLQRGGSSASSLVQHRSSPESQNQERASAFLKEESNRISSHVLSALASHVQEGPFTKVKKMIQDLISRLQQEAHEEAQHKSWCDSELQTNGQTRQAKTELVESLHATIDQLGSSVAILNKDIATLSGEVAELQAALAKAEELRSVEKARNEDTIAEAVSAQMEVARAIKLLQDFYAKAGSSTVLAQIKTSGSQEPPIFDAPYQGLQQESNNVLHFLEVVQSDFARLESETGSAEQAAQSEHNTFVQDTEIEKGDKSKAVQDKKTELATKEQDLQTNTHNLEVAQSELDAALAYYDQLRPSCLDVGTSSSSADRIRRRQEEIAALQEALSILDGETVINSGLYSSVEGGNYGWEVGVE